MKMEGKKKMLGDELRIGNTFTMYTKMKQREYLKLKECADTHVMGAVDVKKFAAKMFGFDEKKIEVVCTVDLYEYDGNGMWKKSGVSAGRDALYCASDFNYMRFSVCGVCWEIVNGNIYSVAD